MRRTARRLALAGSLALWSAAASAEETCGQWLGFTTDERNRAMRAYVERSMPRDLSERTRRCLASIDWQIAQHATDLCRRDGGPFVPQAVKAFATAIEYCEER